MPGPGPGPTIKPPSGPSSGSLCRAGRQMYTTSEIKTTAPITPRATPSFVAGATSLLKIAISTGSAACSHEVVHESLVPYLGWTICRTNLGRTLGDGAALGSPLFSPP